MSRRSMPLDPLLLGPEVARAYGVLNEANGASLRGTFLVGRDGRVAWTLVNGPGEPRDFSAIPSAVAALAV